MFFLFFNSFIHRKHGCMETIKHIYKHVCVLKRQQAAPVFPSSSEDDTAVNYGEAGASLTRTQREAKRKLRDWME